MAGQRPWVEPGSRNHRGAVIASFKQERTVVVFLRGASTNDSLENFDRQRGVDLFQGRLFAQVNWAIFQILLQGKSLT